MKKTAVGVGVVCVSLTALRAGCGASTQATSTGTPKAKTHKPVTLSLYIATSLTPQNFQKFIEGPVHKKYPYITIKEVMQGKGSHMQNFIAENKVPDMIFTWNGDLGKYSALGVLANITPLTQKYNINLAKFGANYLNAIKQVSSGQLTALPFETGFEATFYNKAIFNKFGIAYPKNGMTWSQIISLGKKLTRVSHGVQYRGLDVDNIGLMSAQSDISMINAKTNKASVDTPQWARIFQIAKQVWSIPGNKPPKMMTFNGAQWFAKDKNVAMITTGSYEIGDLQAAAKTGWNKWGVVSYPIYSKHPNEHWYIQEDLIAVTSAGKHQGDVMKALSVIDSSKNQENMVKGAGLLSPLVKAGINNNLGKGMSFLKGKHLAQAVNYPQSLPPVFSKYENNARNLLWKNFLLYFENKEDLNTALKTASQQINKLTATLAQENK